MTLKKRAVGGFAIAASTALALSACGGGSESSSGESATGVNVGFENCVDDPTNCNGGERADGGEITWGLDSGYAAWNGATVDGNNAYLNRTLTPSSPSVGNFDPEGNFIFNDGWFESDPELVSEAPLTVKYTLKEGAGWSDGTPFSVEDAIYNWYQYSANPEFCSAECAPASDVWGSNVESIEEGDEANTIVTTYKEGYLSAEWAYEGLFLFPTHILEENGFEDWQSDPAVMGASAIWLSENAPTWSSGPYVPVDAKLGEYVTFEKNENWLGSEQPTLDKLTIRVVEGADNLIDAIRNGEVDGGSPQGFDPTLVGKLNGTDGVNYSVFDSAASWTHLDLNTQNEFLSDVNLRTAIFTAIDTQDILDKVYPDMGIEPKTNMFFANTNSNVVPYVTEAEQGAGDVDAAKKILTDNGYTLEDGVLKTEDGKAVTVDLRAGAGNTVREQAAEIMQARLKEIGIEVTLNSIPDGSLGDVLGKSEFDMIIFGWGGSPLISTAPSQYYNSDSDSNFGKLEVEGLDDIIAGVNSTTDFQESVDAANAVAEAVVPHAYVLPLSDDPNLAVSAANLVNVRPNGMSQQDALYNVASWGVVAE